MNLMAIFSKSKEEIIAENLALLIDLHWMIKGYDTIPNDSIEVMEWKEDVLKETMRATHLNLMRCRNMVHGTKAAMEEAIARWAADAGPLWQFPPVTQSSNLTPHLNTIIF